MRAVDTGAGVIRVYLATTALFTLATSVIWGVNTLFLLSAGLSLFQVMLVNASFSAGQLIFEVPTGVIADTIGRRASYLIGIAALFVSTIGYVATARFEWGMSGFIAASVALGFGFTCQTGAVEAWLVDALDHFDHPGSRETIFARAGMVGGVAMLTGTLAGGFIGQADLSAPYIVRAAFLLAAFLLVWLSMRDIGFTPRPLRASRFAHETRKIASAGLKYGWHQPVVRPMLFVSLVQGTFFLFFFYSSQPYALQLLGRPDLVWVAGVLTALFGLTGVLGSALVAPLMRTRLGSRPTTVLVWGTVVSAGLVGVMALAGMLAPPGGGIAHFATMVAALTGFGVVFGVLGPVRQAHINRQIPAQERATVLSLDAFFADAGGVAGQPALGWLATATSLPLGYAAGVVLLGIAAPLYALAGAAERDERGGRS